MIAELPTMLLVLLAVLSVLGGIIGYCVALIRAKRLARRAIDEARRRMKRDQLAAQSDLHAAQSDLHAARIKIESLRDTVQPASGVTKSVSEREKALHRLVQQQSQRIKALESQLVSHDGQKAKSQQDIANYKASESGEPELALEASSAQTEIERLPTLSRRVESGSASQSSAGASRHPVRHAAADLSLRKQGELSALLTPDLDIPALAESELPESFDELEFDLTGVEDGGAGSRG